jgi:Big-like domain-containing protein/Calx-beta domain-containing protein/type IX secretion system substrate protein
MKIRILYRSLFLSLYLIIQSSVLFGQTTIDFNSLGYTDNQKFNASTTVSIFTFTITSTDNTDQIFFDNDNAAGTGSGAFHDDNTDPGELTKWTITRTDASEFKLVSIVIKDSGFGSSSGTITAYRDGVKIGSSVAIDFDGNKSLTANTDFENIDEFRIEATDVNVYIDDLIYNTAVVANSAPAIGGTSAGQAVNDNATVDPFSSVTISDGDADNVTATITLDADAKGTLSGTDLSGSGPYAIASKTPSAMQSTIRALTYNPTDNRTSTTETTTFTINIDDSTDDTDDATTTVISSAVAPTVTNVSSGTANGTKKVGDVIAVTVTFSESVTVTGTPQIELETGTTDRTVNYASGSTGTTLTFNYTVQAGDESSDLDYKATSSLTLNSGTINDSGGKAATLTLATPGAANSLGANKALVIDGVNKEPSFTIGAHQTVAQNVGAQTVSTFATSIDDGDAGLTQTLTFNVNNDNNVIFDAQPDIDETSGNLTFTPKSSTFGKTTVTVSLSDDGGTANSGDDTSPDQTFDIFITPTGISINEIHPVATAATSEFVEIYNSNAGTIDLTGLVLVLFNGADDLSYKDISPAGSVAASDFYVIGDAGVTNLDLSWGSTSFQGGPDAVALYVGSTSDFTGTSAPTTDGLVDVIVYGSSDDAALRTALGNPSLQVAGDVSNSVSRTPDGTGSFVTRVATPGVANKPSITAISIPNAAMKVGDVVTATITVTSDSDDYTSGSGGISGTIGGFALGSLSRVSSTSYTATFTITNGGTDVASGSSIPVIVTITDSSGNASASFGTGISQASDPIDANNPSISAISIPAASMKVGDVVTATITVPDDGGDDYTSGSGGISGTIGGFALGSLSRVSSTSYTATFTVINGGTDIAAGSTIPVSITITDSSGNASASFGTAISQASDPIDANNPSISAISIPAASMKVGDVVTATITVPDDGGDDYTSGSGGISGTIGGFALGNFTRVSSTSYTTTFTVTNGGTDVVAGSTIPVSVTITDSSGNTSASFGTGISQASDPIDANNPNITAISIPNATMNVGDVVSATINVTSDTDDYTSGSGGISGTIGGFALGSFIRVSSTSYTATFTVTNGGTDVAAGSTIPVSVIITDASGNASASFGTVISQASDPIFANTPTVAFSASSSNAAESVSSANLQVDLSAVSGQDITVDYAITGTATGSGTDYALAAGTLTISTGDANDNITIASIIDDTLDENNETVIVTLSNPSNATLGTNTVHTYTINDNDATPTVAFGLTADGQSESEPSQDIQVSLIAKSGKTITVDYTVTGTATGGGVDHTNPDGTITFNPGEQDFQHQIVNIVDDALDELDETIILTLSNPTNATLGTNTVLTYTITDNDPEPTVTLSVSSNSIAEAAGTSTVTATLSAVSGKDVTVTVAYTGTAVNGTDYNATASTSITINAGSTSANAAVGLIASQDSDAEGNESIIIDITGVTNGTENGVQQQTILLIDDDAAVVTSVSSTTANGSYKEGDAIDITVTFNQTVTVIGTPQLTLETGTNDRVIDYSGGTGTTTLTFTYTVQTGDVSADLDYVSTNSLALNSGTIKNPGAIDAILTLASPAAAGSLGDNKAIIIDTSVPTAPDLTSITTDSGSDGADEITNDNTLTFNGTAEANSTVEVFIDAVSIGTTVANGAGDFSFDHTGTALTDATISVTAKATDAAGNTSDASTALSVTVDTVTPSVPLIYSIITNDTGASSSDGVTSDDTPTFSGSAEANATIEVFVDNNSIGTTTANSSGEWEFAYVSNGSTILDLTDGAHGVTAMAQDAAGNTSAVSSALNFTIDTASPSTPSITSITADSGADGADRITNDNTLEINGTAEANSTVEVFIDGTSIGTTSADGSGNFSFDHTGTVLVDATYSATAKATDLAGNLSTESSALSFTIDTVIPEPPVITSFTDDSGSKVEGEFSTDNSVEFNGTAEANVTIEVFIDDVSKGTITADGNGDWVFDYTSVALPDGTYEVKAVATDAAGNINSPRATLTFTFGIDTIFNLPTLSPADNAVDVLPSANLVMTFDETVFKGAGEIIITNKTSGNLIEAIDLTSSKISISGSVVTIDPTDDFAAASDYMIHVPAGAFADQVGLTNAEIPEADWTFTVISAPVITSVTGPDDGKYKIGDVLEFNVIFSSPVTMVSAYTLAITLDGNSVTALSQGATANSTVKFHYTIAESDLDINGIVLGSTLVKLEDSSTIKDEFGTDAILSLNNISDFSAVLVDGVKPTVTISSAAVALVNRMFEVIVEFDEPVAGFSSSDLSVTNGTASNFTALSSDKKWSYEITPTADGTVTVALVAGIATDVAGNDNYAATDLTREFDGTAPTVISFNRKDPDPLTTGTVEANFRTIFSEDVTGVDLTDFEVVLTGTAAGFINSIIQVDDKTYDVNVNGLGGQGTIGLNLKTDDTIIDAAANPLAAVFNGQVYTTNYIPTDITLSSARIAERNAVGDVVAVIMSTDLDLTDVHKYSLVSGIGDTDNASFTIDGSSLKAAEVFDFETKTSYSIRVKTDDAKGGTFERELTISIDNVLEGDIVLTGDLDFGVTQLGIEVVKNMTISNIGEKAVEVRIISTPTGFTMGLSAAILEVGESITASISFIPQEAKIFNGVIVASHEDGESTIAITGEGALITGVDNSKITEEGINLYPNPVATKLTIDLTKLNGASADVTIHEMSGVEMFTKENVINKELVINVGAYSEGVYILLIKTKTSLIKKKVLIRK